MAELPRCWHRNTSWKYNPGPPIFRPNLLVGFDSSEEFSDVSRPELSTDLCPQQYGTRRCHQMVDEVIVHCHQQVNKFLRRFNPRKEGFEASKQPTVNTLSHII
jgi:hypothetical protein